MSNLKRIDIMKRGISLALFIFGLWINISAQKFVVVNVTPKGVCISGKVIERKDTIDWNEKITWLKKENCSMVVMPLNDIKYKDKHGRQQEWRARTKRTVSAIDGMDEKDNFFWWLVYNTAMGDNHKYVHLYCFDYPWFFEAVNAYDNSGIFRYHYSPEYQIGLSYLHRLSSTDGKFSIGGMLGTSWGAISQLKDKGTESVSQGANIDINTSVNIGGEPGVTINETRTEYISLRDLEYSDYVDPNHEAEHYKVNVLALGQLGYSPCKGITLDLGVGAAYHQDKYWMKEPYMIKKTYNINNLTGEISNVKEEYVKSGRSMTYKDKSEISLALRLGSFFFIPVDYGTRILLGGGYTYLPSNNKYSSWDACIGLCVDF